LSNYLFEGYAAAADLSRIDSAETVDSDLSTRFLEISVTEIA